jgi:hypothetical protein
MVRSVTRYQLFEFHELPWFPAGWRDLVTDFLSFFFKTFKPYVCVAPVLAEALESSRSRRIIDLCSGAGQPVLSVLPALELLGCVPESITLTDKYPNLDAFRSAAAASDGSVTCIEASVDATAVPQELRGFRTLFTSFHHLRPEEARGVLADARQKGEGVGIFEFTERNAWLWTIPVLLIPLLVWGCTPFMRPLTWRRLVWTYLLPIVPLVAMWDGLISNIRSYSPRELHELIDGLDCGTYRWRIGRVRSLGLSRVTFAVGWSARSSQTPGVPPPNSARAGGHHHDGGAE